MLEREPIEVKRESEVSGGAVCGRESARQIQSGVGGGWTTNKQGGAGRRGREESASLDGSRIAVISSCDACRNAFMFALP